MSMFGDMAFEQKMRCFACAAQSPRKHVTLVTSLRLIEYSCCHSWKLKTQSVSNWSMVLYLQRNRAHKVRHDADGWNNFWSGKLNITRHTEPPQHLRAFMLVSHNVRIYSYLQMQELSMRLQKTQGVPVMSRIYPDAPWRLQQVRTLVSRVYAATCVCVHSCKV